MGGSGGAFDNGGQKSKSPKLGKWCQLGPLLLGFAPGLIGLCFSFEKKCIIADIVYLHVMYCFINAHRCDNRWMA
jgi:uncharacterized membrane protein YhdT